MQKQTAEPFLALDSETKKPRENLKDRWGKQIPSQLDNPKKK